MQNDPNSLPPGRQRPNRTRLVGMSNRQYYEQENVNPNDAANNDISMRPTVSMESVASQDRPSFQGTASWNEHEMPAGRRNPTSFQGFPINNDQSQFSLDYQEDND